MGKAPQLRAESAEAVKLPLNLGLNDGTYMPEACVEVMKQHAHRLALRNYTAENNDPLREAIGKADGVTADRVFLHNGSGPILKLAIPMIIAERIRSSWRRTARHLMGKRGFPILTPQFTYSKIPGKASQLGFLVETVPLVPETGFTLNIADIEAALNRQDMLVYIANPNNPTGNVLIRREQLIPLLEKYPNSRFWIDEAYVQYVEEDVRVSDLVMTYPNLCVSRTFSFAYGLAGVRMGYLICNPDFQKQLTAKLTGYTLGTLHEALGIAALNDKAHLPWLHKECEAQRKLLSEGLTALGGIQAYPSTANFVLFAFTDGRTGKWLQAELKKRKIAVKTLEDFLHHRYDPYFRITLGTEAENRFIVEQIAEIVRGA